MTATTKIIDMNKIKMAKSIRTIKELAGPEVKSFKEGFILTLAYSYILFVFNHFSTQIEQNVFTIVFGCFIVLAWFVAYFILWKAIFMLTIKLLPSHILSHMKVNNGN